MWGLGRRLMWGIPLWDKRKGVIEILDEVSAREGLKIGLGSFCALIPLVLHDTQQSI